MGDSSNCEWCLKRYEQILETSKKYRAARDEYKASPSPENFESLRHASNGRASASVVPLWKRGTYTLNAHACGVYSRNQCPVRACVRACLGKHPIFKRKKVAAVMLFGELTCLDDQTTRSDYIQDGEWDVHGLISDIEVSTDASRRKV